MSQVIINQRNSELQNTGVRILLCPHNAPRTKAKRLQRFHDMALMCLYGQWGTVSLWILLVFSRE